jgi:hypothetical protein
MAARANILATVPPDTPPFNWNQVSADAMLALGSAEEDKLARYLADRYCDRSLCGE